MFLLGYEAAIFKQSKIDTKGGIRHKLLMTIENAFASLGLAHCLVGLENLNAIGQEIWSKMGYVWIYEVLILQWRPVFDAEVPWFRI